MIIFKVYTTSGCKDKGFRKSEYYSRMNWVVEYGSIWSNFLNDKKENISEIDRLYNNNA